MWLSSFQKTADNPLFDCLLLNRFRLMKDSDSVGGGFCNVFRPSIESRSRTRLELEELDCNSFNASSPMYEFDVCTEAAISRARSIASSHSWAAAAVAELSEEDAFGVSKVKCLSFCDGVRGEGRSVAPSRGIVLRYQDTSSSDPLHLASFSTGSPHQIETLPSSSSSLHLPQLP